MDIDGHLLMLRTAAVPAGLERLDGAALAGRARRERRQSQAVTGFAAAAALTIGIIGGLAPLDRPGAKVPFGPPVALTPLIALTRG